MNSITRLIYGLVSSLLLAAGFVRAADRLDPTNHSLGLIDNKNMTAAGPCVMPCGVVSEVS